MTQPALATFKRYNEPNMLETVALSLFAGTVATTVTYPLEYLKTVIQFRSEAIGFRGIKSHYFGYNAFKVFRQMHATGGGVLQFYGGFEANLYGRLIYLLIRNSTYKILYDHYKPVKPFNDLGWGEKMWLSGFSGGLAAFLTTPFVLVSVRQILDSQTKSEWRRNYPSVQSALNQVRSANEQWKGAKINVFRHVMLNISLTLPYDYFREAIHTRLGDYACVQPIALFLAALFSSIVTLPFDNMRTRLMQAHDEPHRNRLNYQGSAINVLVKSLKYEGTPWAMWAGFYPYFGSTIIYAALTIGITNGFLDNWKRKEGLKKWQI